MRYVLLPNNMRPRSFRRAQIREMKRRWPTFAVESCARGTIVWVGKLRGFQRFYVVKITWNVTKNYKPYVCLLDPPLRPRRDGSFESIPHLIFDCQDPPSSGLCLYNPGSGEWSNRMLIAATTVPWAAQWLFYYELWHYDGNWRGGGVGPESVGQARAEALH